MAQVYHRYFSSYITACLVTLLFLSFSTTPASAENKLLRADFRHRPPEMVITDGHRSGPLKVVLEEAAADIGYKIKWRNAHFARSIKDIEKGKIDIIPRMIRNVAREKFANYLGPIGYQKKDILFLVKKGQENLINTYEDLHGLRIEVKRKTAYFERFDQDTTLIKRENLDDENMAKMFKYGRFDTMPVLDKLSLEAALKKIDMVDYSYANYRYVNRIGNYYGMSKNSTNASVYSKLNESLLKLTQSGRVEEIYREHSVKPPAME